MSLAPWRTPLSRAIHRNRSLPYARYFQLATVRLDGRPANRTVVFRGFRDDSNQLETVTDARSNKFDQILNCPWAEVCWYFPQTREQFRLEGMLTLVQADGSDVDLQQERRQVWQGLSDSARSQFTWPHPGKPRAHASEFDTDPPDPDQPLDNFCLLLLDPIRVDHLELRGEPQNRFLYHRDDQGHWQEQAVNP
ncbi:MAG: Npun_F5749 family FMN-dependent PPOX-type flavoprotein [Synechococcales bacterium]|nr:Npun_F5749 family FMN-dependent PPOX-type flavoprotein [Synechococcales bacterium]